jgi:cytohesin
MQKLAKEIVRRKKIDPDFGDARGMTPLMQAAAGAQPEIASLLVEAGADVNARDKQGRAAIHYAAEARRTDLVTMLLDAGADIDARDSAGRTPLSVAYAQSDDELFAALIDRGAQVPSAGEGNRLAHDATAEVIKAIERSRDDDPDAGNDELARLRQLLKQGADPNAVMDGVGTPLHRVAAAVAALPESSPRAFALGKVADLLLQSGADPDARGGTGSPAYGITYAARFGHADRVKKYCIADPGSLGRRGLYGKTALVIAVENNQPDVVRTLIRNGAKMPAWKGAGRSPIETAVINGSDDLVLLLLENGFATPKDKSPLGGPLHIAAKQGRVDLIEPMVDAGYRVNAKDSRGNTPLHLASGAGMTDFAIALVRRGADPLTWNNSGETALSLSESGGHKELHTALKRSTLVTPGS